jgi:hypothetical protein
MTTVRFSTTEFISENLCLLCKRSGEIVLVLLGQMLAWYQDMNEIMCELWVKLALSLFSRRL